MTACCLHEKIVFYDSIQKETAQRGIRDVQEVDVTPTLCHLFGSKEMPNGVEGGVLYQALK